MVGDPYLLSNEDGGMMVCIHQVTLIILDSESFVSTRAITKIYQKKVVCESLAGYFL